MSIEHSVCRNLQKVKVFFPPTGQYSQCWLREHVLAVRKHRIKLDLHTLPDTGKLTICSDEEIFSPQFHVFTLFTPFDNIYAENLFLMGPEALQLILQK